MAQVISRSLVPGRTGLAGVMSLRRDGGKRACHKVAAQSPRTFQTDLAIEHQPAGLLRNCQNEIGSRNSFLGSEMEPLASHPGEFSEDRVAKRGHVPREMAGH